MQQELKKGIFVWLKRNWEKIGCLSLTSGENKGWGEKMKNIPNDSELGYERDGGDKMLQMTKKMVLGFDSMVSYDIRNRFAHFEG